MGEELKGSDSRKMMMLDPRSCEVRKSASRNVSPSGKSASGDVSPSGKSDTSPRAAGPADASLFTPGTSVTPPIAEEKSASPNLYGRPIPEGRDAFAKWDSPPKTQDPAMTTGSTEDHVQKTSPDKLEVRKSASRDVSPSGKSDTSPRAAGPAGGSLFTPKPSGAPPAAAKSKSLKKSVPTGRRAFAKWDSPPKTQDPAIATGSSEEPVQETSPDKNEARPATVGSRGKKNQSKKSKFMNVFNLLKPSKSAKGEEAHLLDPGASEEESSSSEDKEPRPHARDRPLLYTDLTGQMGDFVGGKFNAETDLSDSCTDTTSVSLGDKKCIPPSNPCSRVDSPGSTGDASSLEKEFEDLSSPSKGAQKGLKRTKSQNESSDSEDETKAAMGLCVSPRKRAELQDPDHSADESKDREVNK